VQTATRCWDSQPRSGEFARVEGLRNGLERLHWCGSLRHFLSRWSPWLRVHPARVLGEISTEMALLRRRRPVKIRPRSLAERIACARFYWLPSSSPSPWCFCTRPITPTLASRPAAASGAPWRQECPVDSADGEAAWRRRARDGLVRSSPKRWRTTPMMRRQSAANAHRFESQEPVTVTLALWI